MQFAPFRHHVAIPSGCGESGESDIARRPIPPSTPVALPTGADGLVLGLLGVSRFSLTLPATRARGRGARSGVRRPRPGGGRRGPRRHGAARDPHAVARAGARGRASRSSRPASSSACPLLFGVGDAPGARRARRGRHPDSCRSPRRWPARGSRTSARRAASGSARCSAARSSSRFALWQGGGAPQPADLLLVGAVVAAAIGYAEGARLARTLGGWQVICWVLVLSRAVPRRADGRSRATRACWTRLARRGRGSRTSRRSRCSSASSRGTAASRSAASRPWARRSCCSRSSRYSRRRWLLRERIDPATFVAAGLVIAAIALGRR